MLSVGCVVRQPRETIGSRSRCECRDLVSEQVAHRCIRQRVVLHAFDVANAQQTGRSKPFEIGKHVALAELEQLRWVGGDENGGNQPFLCSSLSKQFLL